MDVLIDKSKKVFNYTSRYAIPFYYYNKQDKKYMYGLGRQLNKTTEYTIHNVKDTDNLDKLALKYYGRPDLFWVIASFNDIQDPFINLNEHYNFIYIPTLSTISYK